MQEKGIAEISSIKQVFMLLELNSALGRKNQFPPAASRKEGRKEGRRAEQKRKKISSNKQTNKRD
jgi:hypothetical protein